MITRFYRVSGYPPNPHLREQIKQEHMAGYDKILETLGQLSEENKDQWPEKMRELDHTLLSKYPRFEDKNIETMSEIEELVNFYGTALAFCIEKEQEKEILTCYIMDNP
jgi:hypothetical protein